MSINDNKMEDVDVNQLKYQHQTLKEELEAKDEIILD